MQLIDKSCFIFFSHKVISPVAQESRSISDLKTKPHLTDRHGATKLMFRVKTAQVSVESTLFFPA